MMRSTRLTVITTMLAILVGGGSVSAQTMHPPSTDTEAGESPTTLDPRISLNLTPVVQEVLKQTMREHLESLQTIMAALAQENYQRASAIAHEELGFQKHHQVMQRERGTTFPKKYQDLAIAHHQAAEDLAGAISSHEMRPILQHLDRTIHACVECHQAYKVNSVDTLLQSE
jgi:hypothetical protein